MYLILASQLVLHPLPIGCNVRSAYTQFLSFMHPFPCYLLSETQREDKEQACEMGIPGTIPPSATTHVHAYGANE